MDLEHSRWLPSAEHMPVFRRGDGGVVRHVYTVSAYFDAQTEHRFLDVWCGMFWIFLQREGGIIISR
jgi:hypothetical protein